jgi:uncharacterized membrane protein
MDWIELALAMALFLASHRLPAALGVKAGLVRALGERGYTAAFSLISLALLWWLIVAAGRAPFVPLWDQVGWHRWAVNLAMPLAILLGSFGIAAANPFAFEGRASGFDPDHPGIAGVTRQPLLWALALWSGAHLLANGDVAHVIVFAPFLLLSLLGMPIVERRRRQAMGGAEWARLTARTGLLPFAALIGGRWRPRALPSLPRLALALGLWATIWHLHAPVIGVWPGP